MKLRKELATTLVLLLFAGAFLKPSRIYKPMYVGVGKTLVVKASQVTPAMAAFEDMYDPVVIEPTDNQDETPQSTLELSSESPVQVAFLKDIFC